MTRQVAALEEHLGARLLQRTTRQVTLTDVGTRYLERARRILADVEEADGSAREERNRPSGRLIVSAPVGFGRLHVGTVMTAYLKRYPEVACELRLSDHLVNLVEDAVDAAVRIGHLADSSLVARQVGEMRRIVVAAPGYLKRHGEPKTPEALLAHQTIQFGPFASWHFVRDGRDIEVTPTPRFTSNSADAALQYAEAGGGVTRVLAYQAAELAAAGKECLREVSMVKALSPEVLHEVVHGCLQLHGGSGFMRGTAIERMVRDARVLTIGGGATEVMLEEVAKRM